MKKNKKAIVTLVICLIVVLLGAVIYLGHRGSTSSKANSQPTKTRIVYPQKFTKVKVDVDVADVSIRQGKKYQVKISDNQKSRITTNVKNSELVVTQHGQLHNHFFNIGSISINGKHLTAKYRVEITVPDKNSLTKIAAQTSTSDLELNNLQLQKIVVDSDTGDIDFNRITANECKLSSDTGDIEIDASQLKNVIGDTDTGDVDISTSRLLGNNSFSLDTGDFTLDDATKKMTYHLSVDTGDIEYFGDDVDDHLIKNYSGSKATLKVDSSTGDITID
ncbi:DUF4097 family beta strand repeat-containing protein [Lactobacillus sp. ESL0731]|uniref:DUF4097 family beta strand repeat-containing protein n=1 Tax=unclassified Lactobacillus TaxID=2620435 RepID=UPI0023F8794B|nr:MULTISPECIES: DUF4097 family beta strand repeat-containing protein [unclassified Lactobacillus]WEV50716.1 DUF4097 family beta strand repeat-containing protein [Lactobacillus sp. ESL0700]WEV61846.1 DUF4097 family beta strand repeat-containing protein [Lactobacillus sp. ESL0731]